MVELQTFIEENAGKILGGKGFSGEQQISGEYRWGSVTLYTRYNYATERHGIEVTLDLSCVNWVFSDCLDNREIKDNVDFYNWLKDKFFPLAEKRLKKTEIKGDIQCQKEPRIL